MRGARRRRTRQSRRQSDDDEPSPPHKNPRGRPRRQESSRPSTTTSSNVMQTDSGDTADIVESSERQSNLTSEQINSTNGLINNTLPSLSSVQIYASLFERLLRSAVLSRKWLLVFISSRLLRSDCYESVIWNLLMNVPFVSNNFVADHIGVSSAEHYQYLVSTYNIDHFPCILIIDPNTRALMEMIHVTGGIDIVLNQVLSFTRVQDYRPPYINGDSRILTGTVLAREHAQADRRSSSTRSVTDENSNDVLVEDDDVAKKPKIDTSPTYKDITSNILRGSNNTSCSQMHIALKLPDGSRKVISISTDITVGEFASLLNQLDINQVCVQITPSDRSILSYPSYTKLVDLNVKNRSVLYITRDL